MGVGGSRVLTVEQRAQLARVKLITRRSCAALQLGERTVGSLGRGLDFEHIREYTPGDDIRSFDWKAFARTGDLMVRQYRQDHTQNIMVVVDISPSTEYISSHRYRDLGAALITICAQMRCPVGLTLVGGSSIVGYWSPSTVVAQIDRLYEQLYSTKIISRDSDTSFTKALAEINRRESPEVAVCVITDGIHEPFNIKSVRSRDFYSIVVLDSCVRAIPSEGVFMLRDSESNENGYIAFDKDVTIANRDRLNNYEKKVRQLGGQALMLDARIPLIPALVRTCVRAGVFYG